MKIMENIESVRQQILNGDMTLADDLARDGIAAIFAGIKSDKWETLMKYFAADGSKELERLCGRDADFNKSRWGMACLAYVAGNSVCTATTALETGTGRGMTPAMKINLDAENPTLPIFENANINSAFSAAFKAVDTDSSAPDAAANTGK